MGQKNTLALMAGHKALLVKNNDKKEMLNYLAPQQIKNGQVLNFKGHVIAGLEDAEDQELNPMDTVETASRVTNALVDRLFKPFLDLLGDTTPVMSASDEDVEVEDEPEAEEVVDAPKEKKSKKSKKSKETEEVAEDEEVAEVEETEEDEAVPSQEDLLKDIKKAIKKGKAKKASKLLGGITDKKLVKEFTKIIGEL